MDEGYLKRDFGIGSNEAKVASSFMHCPCVHTSAGPQEIEFGALCTQRLK